MCFTSTWLLCGARPVACGRMQCYCKFEFRNIPLPQSGRGTFGLYIICSSPSPVYGGKNPWQLLWELVWIQFRCWAQGYRCYRCDINRHASELVQTNALRSRHSTEGEVMWFGLQNGCHLSSFVFIAGLINYATSYNFNIMSALTLCLRADVAFRHSSVTVFLNRTYCRERCVADMPSSQPLSPSAIGGKTKDY
jgi:hypothetical protein